jgi:threonine aldolase
MIDLRSDTVTKPTPEMRRAMAEAEVGDDFYGEDPTVTRLEQKAAEMLGKESALFISSGTMGNLVSLLSQTQMGDSILCERKCHIFCFEKGHVSALCGLLPICIEGAHGRLDPQKVESVFLGESPLYATTRLICLENTHNMLGGLCLDIAYMREMRSLADRLNCRIHVDGARIFNASIALNVPAADLARDADSLTFCLSKGLACPYGAVLVGSREMIRLARFKRHMVGGGLRQGGIMAAAGLVALETMICRLAEDHYHARRLAEGLKRHGLEVNLESVETNMVFFRLPDGASGPEVFLQRMIDGGVLCNPPRGGNWRLVTHYGIGEADVDQAVRSISKALEGGNNNED